MTKKKIKVGRPELPDGEARSVMVSARFRANEFKQIASAIKASGEKKTQWVRNRLLEAAKNA